MDRSSDEGLLELYPVNWCTLCTVTGLPQKWFVLGEPTQRMVHTDVGSTDMLNCDRKLYVSKVAIVCGVFAQDALISPALFALHLSTFRLWIYWSLQPFCGAVWEFTLHRTERKRPKLSFHEHFFRHRCQHKQLLISPSPIPAVTRSSVVPFQSCVWNKLQTTSRLKIAGKDREGEKWFPEPGLTS